MFRDVAECSMFLVLSTAYRDLHTKKSPHKFRTKYTHTTTIKQRTTVKIHHSSNQTHVLHSGGQVRDVLLQQSGSAKICSIWRTIDDCVDEQENLNTRAKPEVDVSLPNPFPQRKVELRNVEEIPPAQLNEVLREFVFTVRTKDR